MAARPPSLVLLAICVFVLASSAPGATGLRHAPEHGVHIAHSSSADAAGVPPFSACNVGPTHHAHLILPLALNEADCAHPTAHFFLSHGATFFCPHTWDVKVLATINEDAARATLCSSYFSALATPGASPMHAFRPTLPKGGLPAEALGQLSEWTSPVLYWVHNFGKDNSAGPDHGWNLTTLRSDTTSVSIKQVLYLSLIHI